MLKSNNLVINLLCNLIEYQIKLFYFMTLNIVCPINAGCFVITTPASSKACIFSIAVPELPDIMAPAWPKLKLPNIN